MIHKAHYVTEKVPTLTEYYVYAYIVENSYEYFHLIKKTVEKEGEIIEDINDEYLRMKAYNFMEGIIKRVVKEEKKWITKMNAYFYLDVFNKPILFDI